MNRYEIMNRKNWTGGLLRKMFYLGFAASGLVACGNKQQQHKPAGPQAVPVTTTTVRSEIVTGYTQYPANVVPLRETELRAEVNGYITRILVADGATVSAGQALYEIDKARFEAASVQAKANLAIAEANRTRIQRDLERYQALAEKDAIARQTLDNARTELENAMAQREAANAALTTATLNLERSVIRAPFAGIVGISQVRTGALVMAGSTLINTISATTPIAVEFQASENDLPHILSLQAQANVRRDSVISLELSGGQHYPLNGKIAAVDRAVNRQTGTITVRAEFDNPEGRLRAGMSALLAIRSRSEEPQLVIPYRAVTEQLGQRTVYVVNDQNIAEQRVIRLGLRSGENVVVEEGLAHGETIVTEGLINLRHGAAVEATPETPGL